MVRRVHREQVVAPRGPRALLLHGRAPGRLRGLLRSTTGSLDDPYARLRRTGDVIDAIAWGPADARRAPDRARARDARARARARCTEAAGPFPAGTPYAADDPELLLWILACLVDSSVAGLRPLRRVGWSHDERDALLAGLPGHRRALRPGATPTCRPTWADVRRLRRRTWSPPATWWSRRGRASSACEIVMRPPVPAAPAAAGGARNFITVGLLPGRRAPRSTASRGTRRGRWPGAAAPSTSSACVVPAAAGGRALRAQRAPGRGLTRSIERHPRPSWRALDDLGPGRHPRRPRSQRPVTRAMGSAPSRQARSRSASRAERSPATARAARASASS